MGDDTISRQAAIDALAEHEKSKGHNYTMFVDVVSECAEIIRDLPSAEKKAKILNANPVGECSACGWLIDYRDGFNYCPGCGARLEEEKDGSDQQTGGD